LLLGSARSYWFNPAEEKLKPSFEGVERSFFRLQSIVAH